MFELDAFLCFLTHMYVCFHGQVRDIVPLAHKAADLAGVPSVCVAHFRYTYISFYIPFHAPASALPCRIETVEALNQ
jgi:hypothetical protein